MILWRNNQTDLEYRTWYKATGLDPFLKVQWQGKEYVWVLRGGEYWGERSSKLWETKETPKNSAMQYIT